MKDSSETNQDLIAENSALKKKIQELEQTSSERIQEENESRARQMTMLYETSVELTVEMNLNALLHSIAQAALDLIGGTGCNCYLYNTQTDLMERVATAGIAMVPSPKTRQRGEDMVGQVWVKGTPLLINDYASWSGRTKAYDSFPSRALVTVPFRLGAEILGILNIMAPLPHQYTQMDVEMLSLFATQAAIAIHNVRIHDRMKMELADRKQAEEALESERTLLRNLIDNVPDLIYAKDSESRFIICNEAMIRRMGMTSMAEIVGKSDFDFLPMEMAQRFRADEQAIIQSGIPMINREEPLATEGGTITRWNLATKVPLLDKQGKRIGIVGVGREITDRKRIDEESRDSEERYRRIIEASSDAILLRSKDNIIYANPTALKLFRANLPGDLIGKQYLDLVHPEDRAISAERIKKTMNEDWIAAPREHRMLAMDGQVVHVESTGVPVKYRGEAHIFGIFRDITERKLAEQEKAILTGIERLISSTLEIDKVYYQFATEARKMIPFDRLSINLNNHDKRTVTVAYVFGSNVSGLSPGDSFPLQGSVNETLERTRTGMLFHLTNVDEITGQYSHLLSTFQAGIRSFMSVPLISQDKVIGVLHFRSKKPDAYKEHDLRLAEKIGVQIAGAIANAQLYADIKKTENSLRESEGRFRALIEQAAVGVAEIVMETGQFITVNRRLCEMVGRSEEELLATTFQAITHPEDLHLHEEKTALLAAGKIEHYSLEKRYIRKDGKSVWVNITVSPLWKPGEKSGRNMIVVEDISERKRMEAEMREMSLRDLLTDLYNRRGFITLAEQQLKASNRAQKPLKLTFIDCDGLKWINDTLGHKEGDKALIDTAHVLRQTFRDSDIIARLGGDEFAVLSIDAADMSHEDFSRRLQQHIDEINEKESRSYKLSLSWGTAMYHPESPTSLDQLISAADELMYDHKKAKRNRKN